MSKKTAFLYLLIATLLVIGLLNTYAYASPLSSHAQAKEGTVTLPPPFFEETATEVYCLCGNPPMFTPVPTITETETPTPIDCSCAWGPIETETPTPTVDPDLTPFGTPRCFECSTETPLAPQAWRRSE